MCVVRKKNFFKWTSDDYIFSLSHIKAASDGGAGHQEVDDIDHASFNIEEININDDNEHDGGGQTLS